MGKLEGCLVSTVEIEVKDKDGKLLSKRKMRSKSFVANFLRVINLYAKTQGLPSYSTLYASAFSAGVKNHSGTSVNTVIISSYSDKPAPILFVAAPSSEPNYGIRVGSGTTTPTPNDYNLASPIAHGTGSGQLVYGAVTVEDVLINGNTISFRIIRTFSNSSGATVTVNEIGLSMRTLVGLWNAWDYVLLARDVLSSSVDVPDGATLTVRYILSVTT
jgi:hypothetical protein